MNNLTKIITIAAVLLIASSAHATITIATFADPTADASTPLFTVDFNGSLITGGWAGTGLNLNVLSSTTYYDAVFTITDVTITSDSDPFFGFKTEGGTIKFFESDQTTEILTVEFNVGWVTISQLGGADFEGQDVTITGPALGGLILDEETFAFSFTNQLPIQGDLTDGFTATAAFTSSAVPEPATIILLSLGSLAIFNRN
ncbi:MAG: PEP-CTERM sorting domain-containing protein [Phycisphaerae bacterium]